MADKKKRLVNREISWLYFNHRVLQEAANTATPVLERLRFLGIYSNNLDEFFRVRVAGLRRIANFKGDTKPLYPDNPKKILAEIDKIVAKYQKKFDLLFKEIINELAKKKIVLLSATELNDEQTEFIFNLYNTKLVNSLNPIMLSQTNSLSGLTDASIYLMIKLQKDKQKEYSLLEIPVSDFPRFIVLPNANNKRCIIMLDNAIRLCLPKLYNCLDYDAHEAYSIKFTRDAEMDFTQDIGENIIEKIGQGVKSRRKGLPIRFSYQKTMPKSMLKFISGVLGVNNTTSISENEHYHNFKDFMNFPTLDQPNLTFEKWQAIPIPAFDRNNNLANYIAQNDAFLHCPYHSFSYYVRLLREASIDPDVKAIKTTVYRLASNSRIVQTLINAARNGKKVTVVVELLARFDESANINWAQRMTESGIKVIFGVEGLKIHSKLTYISRKSGNDIVCIGTGNFHEGNANLYTDVFLFTADKRLVKEVNEVFNYINQPYKNMIFTHLLVSPQLMRKKIYSFIRKEIANAKAGKPAYILCKINHITDKALVAQLYNAAKAGVKLRLIVRGNCIMAADENIEIISIVDRYLEHSRIFFFANAGNETCYISSADWMTRNLDYRIEVAAPIYNKGIQKQLKQIIEYGLRDNYKARIVDGSGDNQFKAPVGKGRKFRSQWELYKHYTQLSKKQEYNLKSEKQTNE